MYQKCKKKSVKILLYAFNSGGHSSKVYIT